MLLRPAMKTSPPIRENNSGENPRVSVAKTAWHVSSSSSPSKKGFLMRTEWPANGAIGILVFAFGNSVEKILGDHAPPVMTSLEHGTTNN